MKRFVTIVMLTACIQWTHAQDPQANPSPTENPEPPADPDFQAANDAHAQNQAAIDQGLANLESFREWVRQASDGFTELQNFNPNACMPVFAASPGSVMPSACDGNEACTNCFRGAVGELNFIRRQLGRLQCIYNMTKHLNESALAFGDNTSGIHAVTGLSWQSARAGIVEQFNSFKQTYDRKYGDMMGALQRALLSMGECEAQYGLPDWYQRFGFIYFEFMKDKYARSD